MSVPLKRYFSSFILLLECAIYVAFFQNVYNNIPKNLTYTIKYAGRKENQMFYFNDFYEHDATKGKDFFEIVKIM